IIHTADDADWETLKTWFYAALSGFDQNPADPGARAMRQLLDLPGRVIIETRPELVVTFDWQKFGAALEQAVQAGVGILTGEQGNERVRIEPCDLSITRVTPLG